ncbi:hypothetical protein H4S06_000408 [Coemansia sp. BCRC 34490]|nr:hypothetical protein H4S06_000408 [Coemansia sp. BCRC 34490]
MRPQRQQPSPFPFPNGSGSSNSSNTSDRHGLETPGIAGSQRQQQQQQLYQTPDNSHGREDTDAEMMSVDSYNYQGQTSGPRLGGRFSNDYTPPSQVAAAAVGRRLDLGMAPRFAVPRESVVEAGAGANSGSGEGIGAQDQLDAEYYSLGGSQLDQLPSSPEGLLDSPGHLEGGSFSTPAGFAGHVPQGEKEEEEQVDQDFVLSLRQEGELEALTRKAIKDGRGAWKKMTMDYLHKQVDSLEQDGWMYS